MQLYHESNYITRLFEKLDLINPFDGCIDGGLGQPTKKHGWIKTGIMHASTLELLEFQLRNKTTEGKKSIANELKKETDLNQENNWQKLIIYIIESHGLGAEKETRNWSKCNQALDTFYLRKEELLGFSLFMAKEKNIEGAVTGLIRVLKLNEVKIAKTSSTVCTEFIKFSTQGVPKADKNSSQEVWTEEIKLHSLFTRLASIIAKSETEDHDGNDPVLSHKIQVLEEIRILCQQKPEDVSTQSWMILQDISYCSINPDLPEFVLVESHSLPRSGHHFLKGLLKAATKGRFSYCESYQEPGCCKGNPCRINAYWRHAKNKHENHLRLIKSHDFHLTDKTFNCMPGMFRIIQLREPCELIASWLELAQLNYNRELLKEKNIDITRIYLYHERALLEESWEIIESLGKTMSSEETSKWLSTQKEYIKSFLSKWVPISNTIDKKEHRNCGNFILPYQELEDPQKLLNLLRIEKFDRSELPTFKPTKADFKKRKSKLITELIETHSRSILEISREIKLATPLLANGNNVWPADKEQTFEGNHS